MPITRAALRRLWFWLRLTAGACLFHMAVRTTPEAGRAWLFGGIGDLPEWTKVKRAGRHAHVIPTLTDTAK